MPVTILEITNRGSTYRKLAVYEHEEDLGVFRQLIGRAAVAAVQKRVDEGKANPLCFDDIWADIEDQFPACRYQMLEMGKLIGVPAESVIMEKLVKPIIKEAPEDSSV